MTSVNNRPRPPRPVSGLELYHWTPEAGGRIEVVPPERIGEMPASNGLSETRRAIVRRNGRQSAHKVAAKRRDARRLAELRAAGRCA